MRTVTDAMLRHIDRDQANIERGISRKTFRKVWADLHLESPSGHGNTDAYIAFAALDAKLKNGKRNRNSIVIADDKVRTMADHWRKQQERSDKAKAAAAKRKAK